MLPRLESLKKRRLHTAGSRLLKITIADLTTGASCLYGFESNRAINKFLPLNYLRIINDSGYDLSIQMHQEDLETIKNNSIYEYTGDYWDFILTNDGSGTATGTDIKTHVQRKPTGG